MVVSGGVSVSSRSGRCGRPVAVHTQLGSLLEDDKRSDLLWHVVVDLDARTFSLARNEGKSRSTTVGRMR